MEFYKLNKKEVLSNLSTSEAGLSSREAERRLQIYGQNIIKEKKNFSAFKIFISQFTNIVVYILLAAFLISLFLNEFIDASVIGIILVINAVLGFIQEYKAEKSIEALKRLATSVCTVVRDGKEVRIPSINLVPGDIITIESGSKVPADCYLLESYSLKSDESILTGESTAVKKLPGIISKTVQVSSQSNMIFSSTTITYGRGKAVVISTSMSTEVGKIADMIQQVKEKQTPLQKKLDSVGFSLGILTIVVATIVFAEGVYDGEGLYTMLIVAISLAVAAIPEGLPAVVTISLGLGVQRMVKKNVLIRKLSSVETLGSTTIICSDKTGTLTCNEMTIKKIYANENIIDVTGSGYSDEGEFLIKNKPYDVKKLNKLLETGLLCNDSKLNKGKVIGDPTEASLIVLANKANFISPYARIDEIPFASENKFMATLNIIGKEKLWHYKGAPEIILKKCKFISINGKKAILTDKDKKQILSVNNDFAQEALRVLALAYSKDEKSLVFLGLVGMIDPPRKEVIPAIQKCKVAGIRVIMITGDHKLTAQAIARNIGLNDRALTGDEIDSLSDEELKNIAKEVDIYARVSPLHKVKILQALKDGHIIAMTGDGVNDAPALKQADIGIAVGSGTDVAKESSNMILLDDNFASIVNAVEEGRGIYDGIKKFVNYLLSSNFGEVLILFTAMLIGFRDSAGVILLPIQALQILWINLVTDGLPALGLSVDPIDSIIMSRKPRNPKEKIISRNLWYNIFVIGILMTAGTLLLFKINLPNVALAQTMAFTTIVMIEMARVFMVRKEYNAKFFSNKWLLLSVFSSIALQFVVVYVPFFNKIFDTVPLSIWNWLDILLVTAFIYIIGNLAGLVIKKITNQRD